MDTIFDLEPIELFENVLQQLINNICSSKPVLITNVHPDIIESAKQDVKQLICNHDFEMGKIEEILQNKAWNSDKIKSFLSVIKQRKTELLYSMLNEHYSTAGEIINKYDWVLKTVLGTSEKKSLKYPLLQIALSTVDSVGTHEIMLELKKEELLKLINALESIDDIK